MDENTKSNLNLYDYVGFPDLQQRIEAKTVFNTEKLLLKRVTNAELLLFHVLAEQYLAWSNPINNFRSHLNTHLLLMYYPVSYTHLDVYKRQVIALKKWFFNFYISKTKRSQTVKIQHFNSMI